MYTLIKNTEAKKLLAGELPALGTALIVSSFLFKFGSFALECSAFLTTWFLASFLIVQFSRLKKAKPSKSTLSLPEDF